MKRLCSAFLFVCLLFSLTSCTKTVHYDSLENYLVYDVPLIYEELLLFPDKEKLTSCAVNEYQSTSVSTLLFDDIYFLLNCTYSPHEYEQELIRFHQLDAEYREDLFRIPAYVMLFSGHCYEYALLDSSNHTIIYVYAFTADFESDNSLRILKDFPEEYRPVTSPNTDICKYIYQ